MEWFTGCSARPTLDWSSWRRVALGSLLRRWLLNSRNLWSKEKEVPVCVPLRRRPTRCVFPHALAGAAVSLVPGVASTWSRAVLIKTDRCLTAGDVSQKTATILAFAKQTWGLPSVPRVFAVGLSVTKRSKSFLIVVVPSVKRHRPEPEQLPVFRPSTLGCSAGALVAWT